MKPDFKRDCQPESSSSTGDEIIEETKDKAMTLRDIQVYVNTKYGTNYCYNAVWKLVRKKKKIPTVSPIKGTPEGQKTLR